MVLSGFRKVLASNPPSSLDLLIQIVMIVTQAGPIDLALHQISLRDQNNTDGIAISIALLQTRDHVVTHRLKKVEADGRWLDAIQRPYVRLWCRL